MALLRTANVALRQTNYNYTIFDNPRGGSN